MAEGGSTLLWSMLKEIQARVFATRAERRHAKVGLLHLWKIKRDFQIRFLREAGLRPEHHLLDIGCGTLRGGIPIIDYLEAGHYYGLDSRADVLVEARRELDEAGLAQKAPVLMPAGAFDLLEIGVLFDYVLAFSVLIHMKDETVEECLGCVRRHLKPGGKFYANVKIGSPHEDWFKWQGFPVVWRTLEFYREAGARHGFIVRDLGALQELGNESGVRVVDEERMLVFEPSAA